MTRSLERDILNALQSGIPVCERPFRKLGEALGIGEGELVASVGSLVGSGVIRRMGPVFDASALGYKSVLAALYAPPERCDEIASVIDAFPEATHSYLRDDSLLNFWFTLTAPGDGRIAEIVAEISAATGIAGIRLFKSRRTFKIRAVFEV